MLVLRGPFRGILCSYACVWLNIIMSFSACVWLDICHSLLVFEWMLDYLTTSVEVLLYVHRNRRFIRDGSPGRPPPLSHSSWVPTKVSSPVPLKQFPCSSDWRQAFSRPLTYLSEESFNRSQLIGRLLRITWLLWEGKCRVWWWWWRNDWRFWQRLLQGKVQ